MMFKYIQNRNTIAGRLSDELVMMDIDKGKYFSLNTVATRIWDLLDVPLSLDELCARLMEEYEVDPNQCRAEVTEVVNEMVKLGVVLKHE